MTLHASTAPGQGPHAAHTYPPSSITSGEWWWASSFGSREKTQGRDLNGEDIQVGKIKSHVATGGLAAVYRGSTRLTLCGEGSQAPLVLSWVGNVAISQLIHAQRAPMPTFLTKPHFRRKEKTSARAGERGEHASDAGCPSCHFPKPLRLAAAAAALRPGAGCRQHSRARTVAQSNKKSPYNKPAGAEQTGSGPLRLQCCRASLAYTPLVPRKCHGSAQREAPESIGVMESHCPASSHQPGRWESSK